MGPSLGGVAFGLSLFCLCWYCLRSRDVPHSPPIRKRPCRRRRMLRQRRRCRPDSKRLPLLRPRNWSPGSIRTYPWSIFSRLTPQARLRRMHLRARPKNWSPPPIRTYPWSIFSSPIPRRLPRRRMCRIRQAPTLPRASLTPRLRVSRPLHFPRSRHRLIPPQHRRRRPRPLPPNRPMPTRWHPPIPTNRSWIFSNAISPSWRGGLRALFTPPLNFYGENASAA